MATRKVHCESNCGCEEYCESGCTCIDFLPNCSCECVCDENQAAYSKLAKKVASKWRKEGIAASVDLEVVLNCSNASLTNLVRFLAELFPSEKFFVPSTHLDRKVNLSTRKTNFRKLIARLGLVMA